MFLILNYFLVNELLSFLNLVSLDIVCFIIILIEFMLNYFEIMKYFEIVFFKKFFNFVFLKLYVNIKGYMFLKYVYCILVN